MTTEQKCPHCGGELLHMTGGLESPAEWTCHDCGRSVHVAGLIYLSGDGGEGIKSMSIPDPHLFSIPRMEPPHRFENIESFTPPTAAPNRFSHAEPIDFENDDDDDPEPASDKVYFGFSDDEEWEDDEDDYDDDEDLIDNYDDSEDLSIYGGDDDDE